MPAVAPQSPATPVAATIRTGPGGSDNPLAGILFMLLAAALFSVMDTLAKALTGLFPVGQILFFRAAGALVIVAPLAVHLTRRGHGALRLTPRRALDLVVCALMGVGALSSFLMAWRVLPLVELAAIVFAAPLIVTALSVPLLKETVGFHRWSAVIVGFIGVVIVVGPQGDLFREGAVWAVLGTLSYALWMISLRTIGKRVPSHWVAVSNAVVMLAVSVPLIAWTWVPPTGTQAAGLLGIGLIGGIAQLFLARAFSLAPASLIAPFDYSYVLYAAALGYLVFGDVPAAATWIGLALLTAAGLYTLHRERVVTRRRAASEPSHGSG